MVDVVYILKIKIGVQICYPKPIAENAELWEFISELFQIHNSQMFRSETRCLKTCFAAYVSLTLG